MLIHSAAGLGTMNDILVHESKLVKQTRISLLCDTVVHSAEARNSSQGARMARTEAAQGWVETSDGGESAKLYHLQALNLGCGIGGTFWIRSGYLQRAGDLLSRRR